MYLLIQDIVIDSTRTKKLYPLKIINPMHSLMFENYRLLMKNVKLP